jgi:vacuolar-type H+-ATPase subunit E/Vma4
MSDLRSLLAGEIEGEIAETLRSAEQQVAELKRQTDQEIAELLEGRKARLESALQAHLARVRSAAELAAAARRIAAIDADLQEVRRRAEEVLAALPSRPEYQEVLSRLIREALEALPTADLGYLAPEELPIAEPVLEKLKPELSLRPHPGLRAGIRLESTSSHSSVSNTLPERLGRIWEEVAPQLLAILRQP